MAGAEELVRVDGDILFMHAQYVRYRQEWDAFEFILLHQLVHDKRSGATYAVQAGSGMGTLISCDACDVCLYHRAEKHWAANQDIQAKYHIKLYLRYRDDIFILARDSLSAHRFIKGFRELLSGS